MKRKYKHYDSIWPWLFDLLRTDQLQEQQERVEVAARARAQAVADAEAERVMCDFYREQVAHTNHETHWHEYADVRQKLEDHSNAWDRAVNKSLEAAAKLDAEKARLEKISGNASTHHE